MPSRPTADPAQFIQGAPVLHVADAEASAAYYRDVLGFTWDFGDEKYCVVWRDNSAIHFAKSEGSPVGLHLFQWIHDVNAYHREIVERGATVIRAPADRPCGMHDFSVRDVNGIEIVFGQDL